MRAVSVEQFAHAQQWTHVPIFLLAVALVGFVQFYFRTGRLWLGLTAIGLRCSALLINFAFPPSLNFSEITALRQVDFLGTSVSVTGRRVESMDASQRDKLARFACLCGRRID